jgi:hypothetical protein
MSTSTPSGPARADRAEVAMTDRDQVEDALRRVVQANLRYYEAVERLSVDYVRAVAGAVGSLGAGLPIDMAVRTADKTRTTRDSHLATVEAPTSAPALVLEAEDGGSATGAFVVENLLAEGMSSPVVVSAFVSDNGHELRPGLVFDPEVVVLAAGEETLVRVVATVDEAFELGVAYRAEVTVPGLAGPGLTMVVRRIEPSKAAAKPASKPRRRSTSAPARQGDSAGSRRARGRDW